MPSPIAHLGIGYVIYHYARPNLCENKRQIYFLPFQLVLIMVLSMLPDFDIVFAILFRDMERFHNNFSHSFFMGFLMALLIAGFLRGFFKFRYWLWFWIAWFSYSIHLIMDLFSGERGLMLLWPFTLDRFAAPFKLFYGVQWGLGWFSIWHLWTIITEVMFVVLILALGTFLKKKISL